MNHPFYSSSNMNTFNYELDYKDDINNNFDDIINDYYSLEDDINNAGAIYVNEPFVIDNNIITSPHYDHMGIWMEEAIKMYNKKYSK